MLNRLPYCHLFKPGEGYLQSLMRSRMAVIYGGYNSLTDLLYMGLPGLVVVREMQDREQQTHLEALKALVSDRLQTVNEGEANPVELEALLRRQLQSSAQTPAAIRLDGAECAARHIDQAIEAHRYGKIQS